MKLLKPIALIILLFAGFRIFSKLKSASMLDWKVKGLKVKGNLLNLQLDLTTDIINNTTETIDLNYFIGDIYLGDDIIGKINLPGNIEIQPGLTQVIVPVYLKPLNTLTQVMPKISNLNTIFYIIAEISFEGIKSDVRETFKLI